MTRIALFIAALLLSSSLFARDVSELSSPILLLTPVVGKNAAALQLSTEQRSILKDWVATAPAKRMAVEDDAIQLRMQLRQASIDGAPEADRRRLAQQIGERESQLLMMRSECVNHWRMVLSPEQYAKALALAGVK